MATKQCKVATFRGRLPPINSPYFLNWWSREVKWQIKKILSPLSQWLWSQNLSWWRRRVSTHKFTWPLFEVVLWGHVTKWIQYISIYRWPKDTKLSKVLTYHERLSSLKQHDPLTKWPTWGHMTTLKNNFFTFTRLIATKLGRVLPHRKRFSTQIL